MIAVLLYTALIFVPITGWALFTHTAWDTAYASPEKNFTTAALVACLVLYFLGGLLGTLVGAPALMARNKKRFAASFVAGAVFLGVVWALTLPQYMTYAPTFQEFHAGMTKPIAEVPEFMRVVNVSGNILSLATAAVIGFLYFRNRKFQTA